MSLLEKNGAGSRGAERAVGERSEAPAGRAAPKGVPDPELVERPKRRRFIAEYKLRILREAHACTRAGEMGALLRREGLYSSHLSSWRKQRDEAGRPGAGLRLEHVERGATDWRNARPERDAKPRRPRCAAGTSSRERTSERSLAEPETVL